MGKFLDSVLKATKGMLDKVKNLGNQKTEVPEPIKRSFKKIRKRRIFPVLINQAFLGKAAFREYLRSKIYVPRPAAPTSTTFTSIDGRATYRVFSDGSYRKMVNMGRRAVTVTT
jgi:hypothetical protein